jgi:hypothetical protein
MKVADREFTDGLRPAGGKIGAGPPRHGAESGEKFPWRERLRKVIVGPHLEPDDPIGFVAAGGQHQDWNRGMATDFLKGLESIEAGHHHVENHRVP